MSYKRFQRVSTVVFPLTVHLHSRQGMQPLEAIEDSLYTTQCRDKEGGFLSCKVIRVQAEMWPTGRFIRTLYPTWHP